MILYYNNKLNIKNNSVARYGQRMETYDNFLNYLRVLKNAEFESAIWIMMLKKRDTSVYI